jgi:hypothetical protein
MDSIDQTIESDVAADIAGYAPAAAGVAYMQRRDERYRLRSLLRRITSVPRLRSCGLTLGTDIIVRRKDGVHHFAGVQRKKDDGRHFPGMSTCGSSWLCPVCAAKIRHHRADEVSRTVVSALAQDLDVLFVTQTIPHTAQDRLGVTLNLLGEGRRYVANARLVKALRRGAGYLGAVTSKEINYGVHGWHPHAHSIEFFERTVSLRNFSNLSLVYYEYLNWFYHQHGFDGLSLRHGVRVEQVNLDGAVLARYVAKVQEGEAFRLHTAHELTRSDLKQGRADSLMPFDIAREFFETGDTALLELWQEYEKESKGKSAIRFTEGLRARLLPHEAEHSDPGLAALNVGGVDVVRFAGWFYRRIARVPGLEGKVLTALDTGGFAALVELLTVYHLDDADKYYPMKESED